MGTREKGWWAACVKGLRGVAIDRQQQRRRKNVTQMAQERRKLVRGLHLI